MDNNQKYIEAFATALEMAPEDVDATLSFEESPTWDSVGHIILVSTLEEQFGIEFNPDDIFALKTFDEGKRILSETYGVVF